VRLFVFFVEDFKKCPLEFYEFWRKSCVRTAPPLLFSSPGAVPVRSIKETVKLQSSVENPCSSRWDNFRPRSFSQAVSLLVTDRGLKLCNPYWLNFAQDTGCIRVKNRVSHVLRKKKGGNDHKNDNENGYRKNNNQNDNIKSDNIKTCKLKKDDIKRTT
jgi:hypothetical protein